ncbi:MAG TPA: DUF721 domain-containing protein [Candidatus Limnocylindria bacterium]|nr:DUF721 domain-containing protein [Candidatus Limnocylindria bacterium]
MQRLADVLPAVASALGVEAELSRARQHACWQRLVGELVPGGAGQSTMLDIQPPALVVSAATGALAQELRLRQRELLDGFARSPDGQRLLELRVVVRGPASGPGPSPRVD